MDNKKSYDLLLFIRFSLVFAVILLFSFDGLRAQKPVLEDTTNVILAQPEREVLSAKIDSLNNLNIALKNENADLSRENLINQLTIENRNFLLFSICVFSCLALFLAFRLYISIQKAKLNNKILKLQNLEIAHQKKELEELNQLKIKFLSIVSHDIRSPLLSLKGVLNLFDANLLNDREETELFFTELKSEFNLTSHLLDNLLIWAKKQMYEQGIEKVGFPINQLIKDNIELQQAKITKCNIAVFNMFTDDILVYADKEMINMVLRNLITNALKFTRFGGEIAIFYKTHHDLIEIGIRDTGVGISQEQINKILDRSFYSTAGVNDEKGSGLGLMLSREFIEKGNGKLWIESKVGIGSTFFFTLPLFKKNEDYQRNKAAIPTRFESVI